MKAARRGGFPADAHYDIDAKMKIIEDGVSGPLNPIALPRCPELGYAFRSIELKERQRVRATFVGAVIESIIH